MAGKPKSRPRVARRDPDDPDRALISPELADKLFRAYNAAAQWQAAYESVRAEVEGMVGDATSIYDTDGRPVVMNRTPGKTSRFNQAQFKEDHPELFAQYVQLNPTKAPFKPAVPKGGDES